MPDLDGFDVAAEIGRRPELAGATIMMLSSSGKYGDSARCRALGIAAYLTKPVSQSDLLDSICSHSRTGARRPAPRRWPSRSPAPSGCARILLAEDNIVNQRVAQGLLTRRGHTVTVVNNGREALAALETRRFDLVLMDVQMPEMGGFEATAAIRATRAQDRRARADRRHDGARHERRSRTMPRGRNGRLSVEAHRSGGDVRGGRAGERPPAAPAGVDRDSALARHGRRRTAPARRRRAVSRRLSDASRGDQGRHRSSAAQRACEARRTPSRARPRTSRPRDSSRRRGRSSASARRIS